MRGERRFILVAALTIIGILFMLPLAVTIAGSFMRESEIAVCYNSGVTVFDILNGVTSSFSRVRFIPEQVSLSQYYEVLIGQPSFLILLTNSIKIALPVALGNLLVSVLTAYGFTIWNFKYKEVLFSLYVIVMLMPLQAVLVPNYIVADMLHVKEGYIAIILPGVFSPFGTFLMRQSMRAIPKAYFEAARIDGAGEFYIFLNIVLPQIRSAAAALTMLVFIDYWNIVEQAVVFIADWSDEPLSVYLSRLTQGRVGLIFAASCVYMLPPLWMLILGQNNLEKGIELSGVK